MQELSFVGIFNAKCDPARYLEAELIRSSKRPARARSRGIRLNIAIAYEALGDHENAWKYLKDLIPADPGKLNKVRLLGILASYYRETGDRQTSDIYKARLEAIRASGKRNPGVELSLDNLNIPDAIEGKRYDEARELIGKYVNSNRISLYNRTIMNYYLGLIAFETNERKEAIYRLMTALENGSKLPLAQKAQEMLDSL